VIRQSRADRATTGWLGWYSGTIPTDRIRISYFVQRIMSCMDSIGQYSNEQFNCHNIRARERESEWSASLNARSQIPQKRQEASLGFGPSITIYLRREAPSFLSVETWLRCSLLFCLSLAHQLLTKSRYKATVCRTVRPTVVVISINITCR